MCIPKLRDTILHQLEENEDFQLHFRLLMEANEDQENEDDESDFDDFEVEESSAVLFSEEQNNWYWFPRITLEQYNRAMGVIHEPCDMYQEFQAIIDWNVNIFQNSSQEYDEYMSILIE